MLNIATLQTELKHFRWRGVIPSIAKQNFCSISVSVSGMANKNRFLAITKPDALWENKGRHIAICGFIIVHVAAAGLATTTLPEISCVVAIVGMGLYMIGAQLTAAAIDTDTDNSLHA